MSLLNRLFDKEITLYRQTAGTWTDANEYVDGGEEPILCMGNIQPYREGVNNFLTEGGFRATSAIEVYVLGDTGDEIRAENDRISQVADEVEYKGSRYKCIDLQDWTGQSYLGLELSMNHMVGLFYLKDKIS